MVMDYIWMLEASLLEKDRQAQADQREAEERGRRAAAKREWIAEQRRILERLKAAMGITDDETDGALLSPSGDEVVPPTVDVPVYERGSTISQLHGPDFWRFEPDVDETSGEPGYDVDSLRGKRNSRERAISAVRIYGYRLRESALADAIFRTGETNAASPASIRGSLSGLVKYGNDWRREHGYLIYQGPRFDPDWDKLRELSLKRRERQQEG